MNARRSWFADRDVSVHLVSQDSASGIRAGVAAGVAVVGLTTGNPEKVLRDAGASLLIEDFRDPKLMAVLQELDPAPADKQG